MATEGVDALIAEVREDFNIPPYFSDASLKRFETEGAAYLGSLNSNCSVDGTTNQDKMFRILLKNYIYYAFNNAVSDFLANYKQMILTWQAESECADSTTETGETS